MNDRPSDSQMTKRPTQWRCSCGQWVSTQYLFHEHADGYRDTAARWRYHRMTDTEVRVDPAVPPGEVHFRDRDGATIGKIVNVGDQNGR